MTPEDPKSVSIPKGKIATRKCGLCQMDVPYSDTHLALEHCVRFARDQVYAAQQLLVMEHNSRVKVQSDYNGMRIVLWAILHRLPGGDALVSAEELAQVPMQANIEVRTGKDKSVHITALKEANS